MKQISILMFSLILFVSFDADAGKCYGNDNCTACTNCSSCQYCSVEGGSCGVCSGRGYDNETEKYETVYNENFNDNASQPKEESKGDWIKYVLIGIGILVLIFKVFR